ncbi:MAG: nitroreductase family protein, partial [Myxococcales bacterium]|nr:nitroreductase family protein [Myxococcales bacterium]
EPSLAPSPEPSPEPGATIVALPSGPPLSDLPTAIRARTSNGPQFCGQGVTAQALAAVLVEAAEAMTRLRQACGAEDLPSPGLGVVVQRVAGVAPGALRRDARTGQLVLVRSGALGLELQACSNLDNINLDLAAFTVHVIDALDFRRSPRGNRRYRIQQMLVGAALDGVMLACAALGLGSHPMLGFDAAGIDALYHLDGTGLGSQAQICVGVARPGHWLEGDLGP